MSRSISQLMLLGVAGIIAVAGTSQLAFTQSQSQDVVTLGDNDGIFVDRKSFKVVRGNGAKGDPAAALAHLGAKEVAAGAIIYRSGDKLYIMDGTPPANAEPQFMKTMSDWCPTCNWYVPQSYMK